MKRNVRLKIEDPVIVAQGGIGDTAWGHTQFPRLRKTGDGGIYIEWEYGSDSVNYDAVDYGAVSHDGGKSWERTAESTPLCGHEMKNGKGFLGFLKKGVYEAPYFKKYSPVYRSRLYGETDIFLASDIKENDAKGVFGTEIELESGRRETFECTVEQENMSIGLCGGGRVYPSTQFFALANNNGILSDGGDLYCATYGNGLKAGAETREELIPDYPNAYSVFVYKSEDSGRTWRYLSQIDVDSETDNVSGRRWFEGFCEPTLRKMKDGSFMMLMRTGSRHPMYVTYSCDGCITWSKPEIFDEIGVYPQLLRLSEDVTLASYGRPELRVRASCDGSGREWSEPIRVPLTNDGDADFKKISCFYTGLIALDESTALLAYSDFAYPNKDGIGVKTILTRRIHVILED